MINEHTIIIRIMHATLLLGVACCIQNCIVEPPYQVITHNSLCGKTDYVHFSSVDTGYIITHIGDLYDSSHCTYVYQTIDGGAFWEIVDSIPNFSFHKYSHTTYKNIVYGYLGNGSQSNDGNWNSYLCKIDLKEHRHKIRSEFFYGPGYVFVLNDSINFPIYTADKKFILRLDDELNHIYCEDNPFQESVKDLSYNDSLLALMMYNNQLCYYFQSEQMCKFQFDLSCDGILLSGNDCYISYWADEEHDGGVIRHNWLTNRYEKLKFPLGYNVVKFLKTNSDSIIITVTQEDYCGFDDDIVYSKDKGQTWKKKHLSHPIVSPEYSSYCAPYLYIKSTFLNEIYKLRIE